MNETQNPAAPDKQVERNGEVERNEEVEVEGGIHPVSHPAQL